MYKIEKKLAKLLKRVPVIWAFIIPAVLVLVIIGLAALIVIQRSENNRLQEDLISLSSELQDRESEKRSIEEQLSEKTQEAEDLKEEVSNLEEYVEDLENESTNSSYVPSSSLYVKCKDSPIPPLSLSTTDRAAFDAAYAKWKSCWGIQ